VSEFLSVKFLKFGDNRQMDILMVFFTGHEDRENVIMENVFMKFEVLTVVLMKGSIKLEMS
jgi:hypothetical protein